MFIICYNVYNICKILSLTNFFKYLTTKKTFLTCANIVNLLK